MKEKIIEIRNLSKKFDSSQEGIDENYALKNIQLEIPRGCIYGIIGMSGAGKSTLLQCLTGLISPTQGDILFDGKPFPYGERKALETLRKQIGMVFQHFQLFSSRTVSRNIAYPMEISGVPLAEQEKKITELLALVGLEAKKDNYPSQLSGGEKQRVGIARALAVNPRLLLCDEPTSALDPKTTRDILELLCSLNKKMGITLIIITHQLETVRQVCQRVAVLSQGQVVEEGEVIEIFNAPKHSVTQHLLRLAPDQVCNDLFNREVI